MFSLSFSRRFGSSTPNQYFENKNHETQYWTVLDQVATLNTSHAQNGINSANLVLQSGAY